MGEPDNNKIAMKPARVLDLGVPAARLFFMTVVIVLVLFGYVARNSYEAEFREGQTSVKNLAGVLASNVENILVRAQSDLLAFSQQINEKDLQGTISEERREDIEARMASHLASFSGVLNYRIFSKEGRSIFGAGAINPRVAIDVSDRDWFRQLRENPGRDVSISEVLMGRGTGSQTIILGLAIRDGRGRFIGAVNAAFNLAYFQQQLDLLEIGPKGLISIRRTDDYRLVLRRPAVAEQVNEQLKDSHLGDVVVSGKKSGEGEFVSTIDNVSRIYAFHSLINFPLTIIVAVAKDDFLWHWYSQLAFGGLIVFAFIVVSTFLFRRNTMAQRRLAKQLTRYHALMQTASDGVHILDRQGNLLEASESFYQSLGFSGDTKPKLNVVDWDAKWSAAVLIGEMIPGLMAMPQVFETVHRRRDGSLFDVEVNARSVAIDGQSYLYASSRDISRRKAMEVKLQTANRDLEQFAYVASHDLRQPLRTVASYLGLIRMRLAQDALSEEIQRFFDFAVAGAKRMDGMITGLLEYSRTGKSGTPPQPVPLTEMVAESLLNLSAAVEESGAVISVAADLPIISGDRMELARLFQNLIGNAIKYRRPDHQGVIDIGHRKDADSLIVWVQDNGIGIPPEDRDRAFVIFQRVVEKAAYEGTGIGLAVCKKIVEAHGGRIWIEESPGGGCTVMMQFPATA